MSRRNITFLAVGAFLVLALLSTVLACMIITMSNDDMQAAQPIVTGQPLKVYSAPVQSPPSAEAIARQLHGIHFKNLGKGANGMVIDSGSFYIKGHKFAVNVFPSEAVKNLWLKLSEPYGVTPTTWTSHWVVYPSVTS